MVKNGQMSCRAKCVGLARQNLLIVLTFIGVGVGFMVGILVQNPSDSAIMWIGMAGKLYIRMLKLMVIPLVVSSVITGTARMDPRTNGRVSAIALGYILVTNFFPCILAAVLCLVIKPGEGIQSNVDARKFTTEVMETEDIFADLLRNIVADNMLTACFQQTQTKYQYSTKSIPILNGTENVTLSVRELTRKYVSSVNSTNILVLIIISAVFGVVAAELKEVGEMFLAFFNAVTAIIMRILRVLIWTTPVGVASLIAKTIANTRDLEDTFRRLGFYFLTVTLGLVLLMFVCMLIVFYAVRRKNPYHFIASIIPSIMIVFATGSTFLTWTSTLAIPSMPGVSLVTVLILLSALTIPGEAAAMLFALEFFLDRFRSVTNLNAQLFGAIVTNKWCQQSLKDENFEDESSRENFLNFDNQETIIEPDINTKSNVNGSREQYEVVSTSH